ncbi:MAG: 4-hydroxy-tetrahydrodipicolinate synthase, partial [Clostridia bacterium]|nr:4-hydroxy-tetrahydrodipicolinate synthase [Clostridia bacterium]
PPEDSHDYCMNGCNQIDIFGKSHMGLEDGEVVFTKCLEFTLEKVNGRIPVIAGTGSNDTSYAVELSRFASQAGADGLLTVTPYYNKATTTGLIRHYNLIADAVDCPIIVYNVPGRTGCNITAPVYRELAKHPNIVGVKEASGNFSQIVDLFHEFGDVLDIYSGDDDQIVPMLSLGGKGVISVMANALPKETHDICQLYFDGKVKESAELQLKLHSFARAMFCEVNPVPIKAVMEELGFCSGELRLPLSEVEPQNREKLIKIMKDVGLLNR